MKVTFNKLNESRYVPLLERTYTVGDTQYWKRGGKYFSWSETGGRKEIGQEEYFKALSGGEDAPPKPKKIIPKIDPKKYHEASDEDLATLASNNDERATDVLIRRYERLVHKIANKYFLKGGDSDDLVQTGLVGMWEAILSYDSDKNDNFGKYIATAIDRRMKSAVRSDDTQKNQFMNTAASMDAQSDTGDGDGRSYADTLAAKGPSVEDTIISQEAVEELTRFMKSDLSNKEYDIILRYINGASKSEIAEDMGVTYKSVEGAIDRVRWKVGQYTRKKNEGKIIRENVSKFVKVIFKKVPSDLEESMFTHDGHEYKCVFGNYSRDGEEITKEEYHKAKQMVLNTKSNPLSFDYLLNMPSRIKVQQMQDFEDFIGSLDYDEEYDVPGETRGHLPKLSVDDEDARISQIMEDSGMTEEEADKVNQLISNYTSTNPSKITGEDRDLLDSYLDSAPIYENGVTFRGMGFKEGFQDSMDAYEYFKNLEVGSVNTFRDYTSFSSNPDVAKAFADENGDHQVLMVNTKNLSGVSVDHLASSKYKEDELIYKGDTRVVVKDKLVEGNIVYLHIEELPMEEDDYDEDSVGVMPTDGSMCLDDIKE